MTSTLQVSVFKEKNYIEKLHSNDEEVISLSHA